jgi:hypothetical protein
MPTKMQNERQDDSTLAGPATDKDDARTGAVARPWDPYDVWLRRVKQPRDDRQPRRAEALAARSAGPATADTGVHRQLVLPPLR